MIGGYLMVPVFEDLLAVPAGANCLFVELVSHSLFVKFDVTLPLVADLFQTDETLLDFLGSLHVLAFLFSPLPSFNPLDPLHLGLLGPGLWTWSLHHLTGFVDFLLVDGPTLHPTDFAHFLVFSPVHLRAQAEKM